MHLFITILVFAVGLVLIIKGGDLFVDAASWMAEVSRIPKFIIGATVVSLATTLPEMLVSVFAAFDGKVDMAIGNAVGSVTANVGLIMSISVLFMPGSVNRRSYFLKSMLLIGTVCTLYLLCFGGSLEVLPSTLLLGIFVLFIIENILSAKSSMDLDVKTTNSKSKSKSREIGLNVIKFILGTVGIVLGAELLVDTGSELARLFGVSEAVISVTLVAIGTSLPELVTTVTAIIKKQSSLSIGNIIGANIIDLTLILPICSLISNGSLPVGTQSIALDIPICITVVVLGLVPMLVRGKFTRGQAVFMLGIYCGYLAVLAI